MSGPWAILEVGAVFTVAYPMIRDEFDDFDGEAMVKTKTWRPGVRFEDRQYDAEAFADGLGTMILTVVSLHKPGRFPTRIFYTRQWMTPEGKPFGKGSLRIATVEKFRRLSREYQYHFEIAEVSP